MPPLLKLLTLTAVCLATLAFSGQAEVSAAVLPVVPGSADAGRVKPEEKLPEVMQNSRGAIAVPAGVALTQAPKGAEGIHFVLQALNIEGATVFPHAQLEDLYGAQVGQEIALAKIYDIANKLTEKYRDAGYFLSRAYVPAQDIDKGIVTIRIVEGYIGAVDLPEKYAHSFMINSAIARLTAERPLTTEALESFLLRLNNLPGLDVSGVLSSMPKIEGAAQLTLDIRRSEGLTQIGFDNFSSRYLGPNEVTASWAGSLLPMQQTAISLVGGLPMSRLKAGTIGQKVMLIPGLSLDLAGSYTHSKPGFTLRQFEVESTSAWLSAGLSYQWIRQRDQNLLSRISFDARNTQSDILNSPLTRDRVRAIRAGLSWDKTDRFQGRTNINATFSQGINGFGASQPGAINLSRAAARPDFTKAEISVTRLQVLADNWAMMAGASGQKSSGALYSAEQFGYGGPVFGRAFDSSEITGDHGLSGSLELRYTKWSLDDPVSVQPFAFYDVGQVWGSGGNGNAAHQSGASAGFGARGVYYGFSAETGVAWPLTRPIQVPIYGQQKSGPRILLNISKTF
ncbi:MAG: hypothetical protein JWO78_1113 [Micavibrio sp.]|nr:hypothetical protein [Micavibrio sp.]